MQYKYGMLLHCFKLEYTVEKSGYQSEITAAKQGYKQKEHFFKREYKKEISSILTLSPKNPVASD